MKAILTRVAAFAFMVAVFVVVIKASLSPVNTYVSPSGSDSNDCLSAQTPCQTLQRAVNVMAPGISGGGTVFMGDGTYYGGATVTYFKLITFSGNCSNNGAVLVTGSNQTIFSVQDHAIVTVRCFTIGGAGSIAIACRQFAICDYQYMRFGSMAIHISANEMSKANCGGTVTIVGSATYHLAVNGLSSIDAGCATTLASGIQLGAFAWAVGRSLINAGSATFGGANSGMQYICDSALISGGNNFPGSGNVNQNGCLIQ